MKKAFRKTHTVDRERLLNQLKAVQPGIANKEVVEQSSCFVFHDGKVMSFNGEAVYSCPCDLKAECAVPARHLLAILKSLQVEQIKIRVSKNKITFFGGIEYAGHINVESEILLPVDTVEKPGRWKSLPANFDEAVRITVRCAAKHGSNEKLKYVNMMPKWLEACDNRRLIRFKCATGLPSSRMVKAATLKWVVRRKVTELSTTRNWLHFRNTDGLLISCRCCRDDYEQVEHLLVKRSGPGLRLPKSLIDTVGRVGVFAASNQAVAMLKLSHDRLVIHIDGHDGEYEEDVDVEYDGHPRQCRINLEGLLEMTRLANRRYGGDNRVRFLNVDIVVDGNPILTEVALLDRGEFIFVTCPSALIGETSSSECR